MNIVTNGVIVGATPSDFRDLVAATSGPDRTAAVAAWFQGLFPSFIELPASWFDSPVRVWNIRFGDWNVRALSPEDVLVDRLASWKFWKVVADGVNAFLVWRDRSEEIDLERLESRAAKEHVADALEVLRELSDRAPGGAQGIEEAERWARSVR